MKWVSVNCDAQPDMAGRTLILPSCGSASVDQLAIDLLCFNFCKQIGRLISDNLDFVASQNPFDPDSNVLASAIDVYEGETPSFGPVVVLRVASNLPSAKRQILDYAKELVEFSAAAKIKQVVLMRSVSSVFCVDSQIKDWPKTIRGFGGLLSLTPIEEYSEEQELLKASVFGELFECLKRLAKTDFGAVFVFVHEGMVMHEAVLLAQTVSGKEELRTPPSWESIIE